MACVLKDYYAQKVFKDTVRIDSSKVYITDTIQMNKILGRSVTLDMKYPVITKDVFYVEKRKGNVYAGGSFNTGLGLKAVSVGVMYQSHRGLMYGTSVGLNDKKLFYGLNLYKKL
jgi:hypothetical protein